MKGTGRGARKGSCNRREKERGNVNRTGSFKEMGTVDKQEKVYNRIPENLQTFIRLNCHFDFFVPHNNLTSYIKTKIKGTVGVISSDPPCKDSYASFTPVPLKP